MNELKLIEIDRSKRCLKFLEKRVLSDNYRGIQISQHNRYTLEKVLVLLKELYNIAGTEKLEIRTTDLSKRVRNNINEIKYSQYVSNVNNHIKTGTQDSIRKNLFVDLHRMGLINRFNGEKIIQPDERKKVTSVSITKKGIELIEEKNIRQQTMLFSEHLNILMKNLVEYLINIFKVFNNINIDEFVFFITFINQTLDGIFYGETEIIELIDEYRTLSIITKNEVIKRIKEYADPKNFSGNKKNKRDYHNWLNESQQILFLLNQTSFFEYDSKNKKLLIKINDIDSFFDEHSITEFRKFIKRSPIEKENYFKKHNVEKKPGYHLHHIIPIFRAKDIHHFKLIDKWDNLLYIDAKHHDIITRDNTRKMELNILENENVILKDYSTQITLIKNDNVFYSTKWKNKMLSINKKLLKTL
ncbi:hypothetical protein NX779_02415 [Mycoplasma cottewii]|uniref:Uncharacterized protein n=1 Tax=Mycoplasma cottewii TaxID=51364 RepID=A0ABY5TVH4_9MOLU|nr:hypothetical protein [Mycoplasma cottewii]UWD34647.1 hypothetical protein NX779_02415 [Mycoplasma cottewii]